MLEASKQTICMGVPAAAKHTMTKVVCRLHIITTDTARFILVQGSWRYLFFPESFGFGGIDHSFILDLSHMLIHEVLLLSRVKRCEGITVLAVHGLGLALPVCQLCTISRRDLLSVLQEFVHLIISEGQLPEHRIMLVDFENFQQAVYRMHAVLLAATATGT